MTDSQPNWSKEELEIYILLLCSNADHAVTEEEINFIKTKVDIDAFNKIYKEYLGDDEETSFEKIDDSVHQHHFSPQEITEIRSNMKAVFLADKNFGKKEEYLDRILDNILY